ncbi:hypothetical protein HGRIS_006686 [Hohenbuehelia grisea]|uniref:Lysosomal dipeptide transporter MFSD1 n=1 Tax=Hohenbuehelia grisea TaxID=104357 RepID=A0ABR3JAA0_9AGAR
MVLAREAVEATQRTPETLSEKSSFRHEEAMGELDTSPPPSITKPPLPVAWKAVIVLLTCFCAFGNHWSSSLIVALKTTILKNLHINNSEFATLVAVTNLVNTFVVIGIGLSIDKWGGPIWTVILTFFHLAGSVIMAGSGTNAVRSYPVLILGKVLSSIGDGSIDNAQHRIFSTYFAPGRGFAFSIGAIWSVANLAQFTGASTANVISQNLGTYAWALWVSSIISLFSSICAIAVYFLDKYLRAKYDITDYTTGRRYTGATKAGVFNIRALTQLPITFWIIVAFCVFENAGVQSFVGISTQFSQQRLKKGAVLAGWVSNFYLLLPACLTPFLGIFIDVFGNRVTFLFLSGSTFLISMLLLRFSHHISTFVAAYIFYALAQSVTPAPQVEIIRNVIPDPAFFATAFAIKKSAVQGSIVIITTAAGRMQDLAHNSLDPTIKLWLAYGFLSAIISGSLFLTAYLPIGQRLLPAARLAQVAPSKLDKEVERLAAKLGVTGREDVYGKQKGDEDGDAVDDGGRVISIKAKEFVLKSPRRSRSRILSVLLPLGAFSVVVIGWIIFGVGISWGIHAMTNGAATGD